MTGNHRIIKILYPSPTTLFHVAECIVNIKRLRYFKFVYPPSGNRFPT